MNSIRIYSFIAKPTFRLLSNLGVVSVLRSSRVGTHIASLFAIHDVRAMISLDLAWWPYFAQENVEKFIFDRGSACRVFEWGAGASTIWFEKRSCIITSIEHHEEFYRSLLELKSAYGLNFELKLRMSTSAELSSKYLSGKRGYERQTFEDYVCAIDEHGLFDIIVIDGRARADCLQHAIEHLKEDGIVVFDNSNRARYAKAIKTSGLVARKVSGLTPASPWATSTTFLAKKASILDHLFQS